MRLLNHRIVRSSFLWMLSLRLSHSFVCPPSSFSLFRRHLFAFHSQVQLSRVSRTTRSFSSSSSASHHQERQLHSPEHQQSRRPTVATVAKSISHSGKSSSLPTILLKRSRQSKAFRNGNPLVFTRAVQSVPSHVQQGDLVEVAVTGESSSSPSSNVSVSLGFGVYNPNSLYRVRILCHRFLQPSLYRNLLESMKQGPSTTEEEDSDILLATILHHHITTSLAKRHALNLPNDQTNVYRLVNGEGDTLSGLAIDLLNAQPTPGKLFDNAVAVVMSSAAWCQIHKPVIKRTLMQCLPGLTRVIWKTTPSRLSQDGYVESDHDVELVPDDLTDDLKEDHECIVRENGVLYKLFPCADGQKTGVYCDQRENRLQLSQLCQNKRVLDLCCYHGGFALNALLNGKALSATVVDSSHDAIAVCLENAHLNHCQDQLEAVAADITSFLQGAHGSREFDVVVLDPPKLAPTTASLDKARRKYHGINRDAIKIVSSQGGLLLTCTCSAAMTQKDGGQYFLDMVSGAGLAAGRSVTLLRVSGAAPCHTQAPVAWPAGSYLTAALFYVHPLGS